MTEILIFVTFFLICRLLISRYGCKRSERRRNFPPRPTGLPLLGNLAVFLGDGRPLCVALRELGATHGDVFGLQACSKEFVVLSSSRAIRDAFVRRSVDFAGRPYMFSLSLLTRKNCGIAFSDYGPAWRGHRKDAASALRMILQQSGGVRGRSIAEKTILQEVSGAVSDMAASDGRPIDPSETLTVALINTVCSLTFGCRYGPDDAEMKAFVSANHKLKELFKPGHPLDLFPFLKIFPSKRMRTIQELIKTRDSILQAQYEDHVATFRPDNIRDITDAFLKSVQDSANRNNGASDDVTMTEDQVVMSMWEIFAGGFESTFQTLRWALAYLIHYPEVQKRLQAEIDNNVPAGLPTWGDRSRLPYLEATVLETLRHSSFSSLNGPHVTTCDTKLGDYDIPQGTTVLCNLWWVHHDPENWKDPNNFRPEHFLDEGGRVFIPEHFLPFSIGPRFCLGKQLATMGLFLYLGGILKHFSLQCPPGEKPPSLKAESSDPIRTIGGFRIALKKRQSHDTVCLPA
ncbi:steroid 17-alpha-hydroxylase/17,20 lyase-like [Acanthaster planci]|uniref:Steroid 21-hydroxylase n=1 Tax=Acanthaster planci TaxID=133434 RepID=A0A8B7Y945_ACAPL|nr:steroid 17-alpha-hydroxylase/17,20 lyase-like [Acanthaster planci]